MLIYVLKKGGKSLRNNLHCKVPFPLKVQYNPNILRIYNNQKYISNFIGNVQI